MKYYILIIATLVFQNAFSQSSIVVESDRSQRTDSIILYANIPNKVTLKIINAANDIIPVRILPDSRYEVTGDDIQSIYIESVKEEDVSLKLQAGGEMRILQAKLKLIPDPYVALNRSRDTAMSKRELLLYQGLIVFFTDLNFKMKIAATSYEVTANNGDGWITVNNSGPYFNPETKELLKAVKPGTRVFFDDIRVVGPDMRARRFNSFNVKVY